MMTEEEARKRWCPYAKVASVSNMPDGNCGIASANRFTAVDDECNCIASECMAWRLEFGDAVKSTGAWIASLEEYRQALEKNDVEKKATGRGYCGLAGHP